MPIKDLHRSPKVIIAGEKILAWQLTNHGSSWDFRDVFPVASFYPSSNFAMFRIAVICGHEFRLRKSGINCVDYIQGTEHCLHIRTSLPRDCSCFRSTCVGRIVELTMACILLGPMAIKERLKLIPATCHVEHSHSCRTFLGYTWALRSETVSVKVRERFHS